MVKGIDMVGRGTFCATIMIVGLLVAGPAFANPPNQTGDIDVVTSCTLDVNQLTVTTQVTDITDENNSALLDKIVFTCMQKTAPGKNGFESCAPTEIEMDFDPDMDLANGVTTQTATFTIDLLSARDAKGSATVYCENCRKNVSADCTDITVGDD